MAVARFRRPRAAGTELREALKRRLEVVIICSTDVGKSGSWVADTDFKLWEAAWVRVRSYRLRLRRRRRRAPPTGASRKQLSPDDVPGQAIVMRAGSIAVSDRQKSLRSGRRKDGYSMGAPDA